MVGGRYSTLWRGLPEQYIVLDNTDCVSSTTTSCALRTVRTKIELKQVQSIGYNPSSSNRSAPGSRGGRTSEGAYFAIAYGGKSDKRSIAL